MLGAITGARKSSKGKGALNKSMSRSRSPKGRATAGAPRKNYGSEIMGRAAQIANIKQRQEKHALNSVLRMHDNQIQKGLNTLRKR